MDAILNYTAIKFCVLAASAFAATWISALAVAGLSVPIKARVSFDFSAAFSLIFSAALWLLPLALKEISDDIPEELFWVEIAIVLLLAALYLKYRLACGWRNALILFAGFALSEAAVDVYLKVNILNQSV